MATKGELISEKIVEKIKVVTDDFINQMGTNAPSQSLMSNFKTKWQEAIAEGLYNYISNEYEFDVKTNGAITLTPPPPGATLPVLNYAVEGNITVFPYSILSTSFNNTLNSTITDASLNMTTIFNDIFSWLPKVSNVTGPVTDITVNPISYLSTVTGVGTIIFPNFIPSTLAEECVNETSAIEFVDNEGKPTGKGYKEVWDVIGKYIYKGIDGNIIATVDAGTPNTTNVPTGIAYIGTGIGTLNFN